jgi:hypothetical protein
MKYSMPFSQFAAAVTVLVIVAEFTLWRLFRRRVLPICFPHETDSSPLRFFSLTHLRLVAVVHTIFVIAVVLFPASLLW